MSSSDHAVKCVSCDDAISGASYRAGNDKVCLSCAKERIVPRFENAIKYEMQFPPHLPGGVLLDHHDYHDLLPKDYSQQLGRKAQEYEVMPIAERLYCSHLVPADLGSDGRKAMNDKQIQTAGQEGKRTQVCGAWVGQRSRKRAGKQCVECSGFSCGHCGAPRARKGMEVECCDPSVSSKTAKEIDKPGTQGLEGAEKGKDYQECPNTRCRMLVYLGDGCNHMTCPRSFCNSQFCFLCGQPAEGDSGHWGVGSPCPRFGRRGDGRAIHDGVPQEDYVNPVQQATAPGMIDLGDLLGMPPEVRVMVMRDEFVQRMVQGLRRM